MIGFLAWSDARDSALHELPDSVRHLNIFYVFDAKPSIFESKKRPNKRRQPVPFLSLRRNGLGVTYIGTDEKANESERRLRLTCLAIIKGLTEGSLRSVTVLDAELLRVAEMLPCWIALDLPSENKDVDVSHWHWSREVRSILAHCASYDKEKPHAVFNTDAVADLKSILQGCCSGNEVHERSQELRKAADDEAASGEIFTAEILASWLADDEDLCHAVFQGLRWTRS